MVSQRGIVGQAVDGSVRVGDIETFVEIDMEVDAVEATKGAEARTGLLEVKAPSPSMPAKAACSFPEATNGSYQTTRSKGDLTSTWQP